MNYIHVHCSCIFLSGGGGGGGGGECLAIITSSPWLSESVKSQSDSRPLEIAQLVT